MDGSRVRDVMTHLVVTFRPEDKIPEAAKRLLLNRISGAPVVDGGRLVGVVSEADLIRAYVSPDIRSSRFAAPRPLIFLLMRENARSEVDDMTVGQVMTRNAISIGPDESVGEAASLIERQNVRRLPVVDEDGYVIGVLTRTDLVRSMARNNERLYEVSASRSSA